MAAGSNLTTPHAGPRTALPFGRPTRCATWAGWVLALAGTAAGQAAAPPVIPTTAPAVAAPRPLLVRLADDATYPRPDAIPPVGAVDDRVLPQGTLKASWRWIAEDGDEPRAGRAGLSPEDVRAQGYSTAAVAYRDRSHLLSLDYGATEDLTLGIAMPFLNRSVELERADGSQTKQSTNRFGDVRLRARLSTFRDVDEELSVSATVQAPTASTDRVGDLPEADPTRPGLPYVLQPGDGAWSLVPGVLWLRWTPEWSFGAHARYAARLVRRGEWDRGDEATADLWMAHRLDRDTSVSLRVEGRVRAGVQGQDPVIDPAVSNLHDPFNSGEKKVQVFAGVQYVGTGGHRFAAELGTPVYQDLDGVQVQQRTSYLLGWSFSF